MKKTLSVQVVVEAGLAVALSLVLATIALYQAPEAGRVTAGAMVPLLFLALRRGPVAGMMAGVVYGMLHYFQDPFFAHPVQFVLDYPLAFLLLGVAGYFRRLPVVGVAAGILMRFACHVISGVVFFASYAPKGMNPWVYSAAYNATYLVPEFIIAAVVIWALWRVPAARGEVSAS